MEDKQKKIQLLNFILPLLRIVKGGFSIEEATTFLIEAHLKDMVYSSEDRQKILKVFSVMYRRCFELELPTQSQVDESKVFFKSFMEAINNRE